MKKIATLTLACMAARAELTKEHSQQIEVAKAIKPARRLKDILNGNVKDLVKPKKKEIGRRLSGYQGYQTTGPSRHHHHQVDCGCGYCQKPKKKPCKKKEPCPCKQEPCVCQCKGFPQLVSQSDKAQKYTSALSDVQGFKQATISGLTFMEMPGSEPGTSESGTFSGTSSVAEVGMIQCVGDPPAFIDGKVEGHYNCNEAKWKIKPNKIPEDACPDYQVKNTWLCSGWYNPSNYMLTATCNNGENKLMWIREGTLLPM